MRLDEGGCAGWEVFVRGRNTANEDGRMSDLLSRTGGFCYDEKASGYRH